MDNKKIASELVKLAKELTAISETKTQKAVRKAYDDIYKKLFNLDINLSNGFIGDKSDNDKAIEKIRKNINSALKSNLDFTLWNRSIENITNEFKVRK